MMWDGRGFLSGLVVLMILAGLLAVGVEHCGAWVYHHVSVGLK